MCKKILTNVSERTVFRLVAQKNNTGNVELQTSKRGFIDESGVNIDMTRLYGRSQCTDSAR